MSKEQIVNNAVEASSFFEVSIDIKVFGKTIWSYRWPPKK